MPCNFCSWTTQAMWYPCGRLLPAQSDEPCSIPPLLKRLSYSQVSAGALHTVLLRSDGSSRSAQGRAADSKCRPGFFDAVQETDVEVFSISLRLIGGGDQFMQHDPCLCWGRSDCI